MTVMLLLALMSNTLADMSKAALVFGPPTQRGQWKEVPTVIVCATAPVRIDRVQQAVDFWKRMGYNIGEVLQAEVDDFSCERDIVLFGDILIDVMNYTNNSDGHLGTTTTWADKATSEIFKAKIEIMPGWGDAERIVEHELGHALGWRDYNQLGHLMHEEWPKGGHNVKGLKK